MKVHELQLKSSSGAKRVGRGIGSGKGKTAGRGTKGQNARTGGGVRPGFEGGQNPLAKRLPKKRGFRSLTNNRFQPINLSNLDVFKVGSVVDFDALVLAGLIKQGSSQVKLLGGGELKHKLTIKVQAASAAAKAAVATAGGKLEIVPIKPLEAPKTPQKATKAQPSEEK